MTELILDLDSIIKADSVLFFDMDGTLIDTDLANFLSYKKAIQFVTKSDKDLVYTPDQRFNRSVLNDKIPNLTENEYDRIINKKEHYYKDFLTETKLNKAITDILFKYSKTNKTVLVTNSREKRAKLILNYHGLTGKFSSIFYRQETNIEKKVNKYSFAISCLNISAKSVVIFENEDAEIGDARTAGINNQNLFKI